MTKAPLVSICCTTYNHAAFISQAIQGFLMQKTTFPIEIIIHDDASTDGTAEIVKNYAEQYPDLITPIFQTKNQYSQRIKPLTQFVFPKARGEYIALCEGDDYWTDPYKLQKQTDFLVNNPDYIISFHNACVIDEQGCFLAESLLPDNRKKNYESPALMRGAWLPTLSMVFRKVLTKFPEEYAYVGNGDKFLISLLGRYGKAKYHTDIMPSKYRRHGGGIWSLQTQKARAKMHANTFYHMANYYKKRHLIELYEYFGERCLKSKINIFIEDLHDKKIKDAIKIYIQILGAGIKLGRYGQMYAFHKKVFKLGSAFLFKLIRSCRKGAGETR